MEDNKTQNNNPAQPVDNKPIEPTPQPVEDKPIEPVQSSVPPVEQAPPIAQAPPITQDSINNQPKNGKKSFLIIFLIILVLITGFMLYLMQNNKKSPKAAIPVVNSPTQVPQATPTASGSAEEKEVQSIDIKDTSPTDFPAVESDIKGL